MHVPVLLEVATDLLTENRGKVYLDCTLGGGGHARRVLEKVPEAKLIGIDVDEEATEIAKENLKEFGERVSIYKANFKDLDLVLKEEGVEKVDGVLFDLGMSMYQIRSGRGFSFQGDEPLDMRMDKDQRLTAYEVVNKYPERELERIIREYGEERLSKKIARAIVRRREKKPIETTKELVEVILSVYPEKLKRSKIHPATRTFQAIRIEVNKELENLKIGLGKALEALNPKGRLVVISFHSLEDRIVKRFMKEKSDKLKVLTKKPVTPSEEEVRMNPSSRSAKLRAGERV